MTTVLSGKDGALFYEGQKIGKVKSWQLQRSRDRLTNTTLDEWDESWVPGRRSGAATAVIWYDTADVNTSNLLNSLLVNKPPKSLLGLSLRTSDVGFDIPAYVESISPSVSVGAATSIQVSFKIPAAGVQLLLNGPNKVFINDVRRFEVEIAGVEGAWNYQWEAVSGGPVIASPNAQTTNITFPSLGTARIRVTATLGTLVLTDFIDVVVENFPLFWIASTTNTTFGLPGSDSCAHCVDNDGNIFYAIAFNSPSTNAPQLAIAKFNRLGALQWIKRIARGADTYSWASGISLQNYGYGMGLTPMQDGGCTVFVPVDPLQFRLSSTGNLVWARTHASSTGPYIYNWVVNTLYVPSHNAIYTGHYYISGGFGRGALRSWDATTGEPKSQVEGLADSATFPGVRTEPYLAANWPRSMAYNPLNDTLVIVAKHNDSPLGFDLHEAPPFLMEGGNISLSSYRLNPPVSMPFIGGQGGSLGGLGITASGQVYTTWADGALVLDSTFNCINAVNRNSSDGIPPAGLHIGSGILSTGEFVRLGVDFISSAWEIYSADLTTRRAARVTGSAPDNYNWGYSPNPGGVRMEGLNVNAQIAALHFGRAMVGFRLFPPPGTYTLTATPGDNRGIRLTSFAQNTTTALTELPTRSTISFTGDTWTTLASSTASVTVSDEPEISEWVLNNFTI